MSVNENETNCNGDLPTSQSVNLYSLYTNAFQQLRNGHSKEYNTLVSVFANPDLPTDILISHIQALRKCVVLLKREQEALIGSLLSSNWSNHPQPVGNIFKEFIAELVSAQTIYIKPCVHSFIRGMVPKLPKDFTEQDLSKMNHSFDNIHLVLMDITRIVPLCSVHITDAVSKYFPYIGKSLVEIEKYVINILRISTYVPNTRYKILSIVLDNMLLLDVQIPKSDLEDLLLPGNELGPGIEGVFGMEEDKNEGRERIDKLDQLMVLMFTFVSTSCSNENGTIDWPNAYHLVLEFMQLFEDIILLYHQSSHVQFILFFLASLDKTFCESFLQICWKNLQDPNVAPILRQKAACYIASFLARANFVPKRVLKLHMRQLAEWIHKYIDMQDDVAMETYTKHGPFYSACQALFYLFVYHHKDIMDSKKGKRFADKLNFMRIITSKMNPLRFCLDTVVKMFARITRVYEVVFCYSVIERNNRLLMSSLSCHDDSTNEKNFIDSYFPFDPYLLPRSLRFIKPLYRMWTGGEIESDSENEIDTSDIVSDNMSERRPSERRISERRSSERRSSCNFDMMCVSPGFSLSQHEF